MTQRTLRIRRCDGNKAAWLLVAIRADGSESDSFGSYATAMSIDGLLKSPHAKHLLVDNPKIELIAA